MALFRYLRPVGDSSHGSVSQSVPHGVLAEVNKEIARSVEKRGGRWGSYLSGSVEEKAQVATYTSTHSVRVAIKHFSKAFGKDLKENTVRDWVKAYKKELCLLPLPLVIFYLSNSSTKARLWDVCLISLFQVTGTSLSHPTGGLTSKR